jgi:hypothetical protein
MNKQRFKISRQQKTAEKIAYRRFWNTIHQTKKPFGTNSRIQILPGTQHSSNTCRYRCTWNTIISHHRYSAFKIENETPVMRLLPVTKNKSSHTHSTVLHVQYACIYSIFPVSRARAFKHNYVHVCALKTMPRQWRW